MRSLAASIEPPISDARIPKDRQARLTLLRGGLIPWLAGIDPDHEGAAPPRRGGYRLAQNDGIMPTLGWPPKFSRLYLRLLCPETLGEPCVQGTGKAELLALDTSIAPALDFPH